MTLSLVMTFRYNTKITIHEKRIKLDFIKIKNICSEKDTVKRLRRQATDWEKMFAKDIADKGLLSKVNEELLKLNDWASLVAQWLRVCLPMQGTRVRALVWEDPTCRGAIRPVSHDC